MKSLEILNCSNKANRQLAAVLQGSAASFIVLILVLLTGCKKPSPQQLAKIHQIQIQRKQKIQERNNDYQLKIETLDSIVLDLAEKMNQSANKHEKEAYHKAIMAVLSQQHTYRVTKAHIK